MMEAPLEYTKDAIRKKLQGIANIKDKLFYLDEIEAEVKDRIYEIYRTTRMDEVGDFLYAENEWEFVFEHREFNPEFMLTPPLDEKQQAQYLKDYADEIKEATHLNNIDSFIHGQKKFYEKQFVKYGMMGGENGGIKKMYVYDCYGFDFYKIKNQLDTIDETDQKLNYLYYLKKELENLRYIFKTSVIKDLETKLNSNGEFKFKNAIDLNNFISRIQRVLIIENSDELNALLKPLLEQFQKLTTLLPKEKDFTGDKKMPTAVIGIEPKIFNEMIELETRKFEICLMKVNNEINYLAEIKNSSKSKETEDSQSSDPKRFLDNNVKYEEYYAEGIKLFLMHKKWKLSLIEFYAKMEKTFGDDIELCRSVYYKISNEYPIIRIFGYDIEDVKRRMEICKNEDELNQLIEIEKSKTENLLNAIQEFRPLYYEKWEKSNIQELDDDWLEQKGYTKEKDSSTYMHYNGWLNYYLEEIDNKKLIEMIRYGLSGRNGKGDDIKEANTVQNFMDHLESDLRNFKEEIAQTYVYKNAMLIHKYTDKITVKKKKWNKNKSEFARLINEVYDKNKNNYKSLRDANNKLFDEYEFEDKNWTKEKCYELVKKT